MIQAEQIRAARALLNWNQGTLAEKAGISVPAIANIETEKQRPNPTTAGKIQTAFQKNGIEFIDGGVRRKNDLVQVLEGPKGLQSFFDDVYHTVSSVGGEILISGVAEEVFWGEYKEIAENHAPRMEKLENFKCLCLIKDDDNNDNEVSYAHYKRVPKVLFADVPFYIYGEKLAIILWLDPVKIIIIDHPDLMRAYRKQFKYIWDSIND